MVDGTPTPTATTPPTEETPTETPTATPTTPVPTETPTETPTATPTTPVPTGPAVLSFTLIDSHNDVVIAAYDPILDGAVIDLAAVGDDLNIVANTDPATVGSVRFQLSGPQNRTWTENVVPYALFGNDGSNFYDWTPAPGVYTLTATAYTGTNAGGSAGTPLTITFTVTNSSASSLTNNELVADGGFETEGAWTLRGDSRLICASSEGNLDQGVSADGTCALTMRSGSRAAQSVDLSGLNPGQTVTLSALADSRNLSGGAVIRLRLSYADGSTETLRLRVAPGSSPYAALSQSLTLRDRVTSARLLIRYNDGSGRLRIDSLSLTADGTSAVPEPSSGGGVIPLPPPPTVSD